MGESDDLLPKLVLKIAKLIVDDQAALALYICHADFTTHLIMVVSPNDEGKIVGLHGSTIQAIRTILIGKGRHHHKYIFSLQTEETDELRSLRKITDEETQ